MAADIIWLFKNTFRQMPGEESTLTPTYCARFPNSSCYRVRFDICLSIWHGLQRDLCCSPPVGFLGWQLCSRAAVPNLSLVLLAALLVAETG